MRYDDLDIALPHEQVPSLRELLAARGFKEQLRADSWKCNFVLADEGGTRWMSVPIRWTRRSEHLTGRGSIDGYRVRCIGAEWLVQFHTGYEPDENDRHDVRLLCERFGIAVPDAYRSSGTTS